MAEEKNDKYEDAEVKKKFEELFKKLKFSNYRFCPYCRSAVEFLWIHGHYQCPKCKNIVISCCGDI
ncbi:MAG: hypothetical protein IT280_06460 [Ignavibacteria bacterium]|nr:hypothetical protein [Ignavibacteria bacterium]